MIDGWLLDVHENAHNTGMVVWIIDETGTAHACEIPWTAALHVHAPSIELQQLEHWLMLPEISARFGVLGVERRAMHLDLEGEGRTSVLEVRIGPFHHLKALAEHIEARGGFPSLHLVFGGCTSGAAFSERARLRAVHKGALGP